jgi:hypothetical protein
MEESVRQTCRLLHPDTMQPLGLGSQHGVYVCEWNAAAFLSVARCTRWCESIVVHKHRHIFQSRICSFTLLPYAGSKAVCCFCGSHDIVASLDFIRDSHARPTGSATNERLHLHQAITFFVCDNDELECKIQRIVEYVSVKCARIRNVHDVKQHVKSLPFLLFACVPPWS